VNQSFYIVWLPGVGLILLAW